MKVAALIPTIHRPDGLHKVLSSLTVTAPEVEAIVAGEKDDYDAKMICDLYFAKFVTCDKSYQGPGYAWNVALKNAKFYDAYFLASDDCVFFPNWYEEIMKVLKDQLNNSGLVGINDGRKNSEGIKSGRLEPTHYLMTRDFIIEYNGGLAAYPYPVDFTDTEACQRARKANKFAYAENSIVRHNWIGANNPDEAFRRNQSKMKEAKLMYAERKASGFPNDVEAILK